MPSWCLTAQLQAGPPAVEARHCIAADLAACAYVPGRVLSSRGAHAAPEASLKLHLAPISCLARSTSQVACGCPTPAGNAADPLSSLAICLPAEDTIDTLSDVSDTDLDRYLLDPETREFKVGSLLAQQASLQAVASSGHEADRCSAHR